MSKRRALKFSGVSVVENIVGFVVVFFTKNTQLKMTEAHLKLSNAVLYKNFWQTSGILEVLLKFRLLFVTIKKTITEFVTQKGSRSRNAATEYSGPCSSHQVHNSWLELWLNCKVLKFKMTSIINSFSQLLILKSVLQ